MLSALKGFTTPKYGHYHAQLMATRPTVLYPERLNPASEAPSVDQATHFSHPESEDLSALLPEDHLLALREGTDYLRGILLLLNEHLQHSGSHTRDSEPLTAVTEHALQRMGKVRLHLEALTEDYLQRMRDGKP